ncbi:hypothetical protein WAI453_001657 [Rhynchosporium graminicola]
MTKLQLDDIITDLQKLATMIADMKETRISVENEHREFDRLDRSAKYIQEHAEDEPSNTLGMNADSVVVSLDVGEGVLKLPVAVEKEAKQKDDNIMGEGDMRSDFNRGDPELSFDLNEMKHRFDTLARDLRNMKAVLNQIEGGVAGANNSKLGSEYKL